MRETLEFIASTNFEGADDRAIAIIAQFLVYRAKDALATDYRAVKTYHEGKPVYVSQPEQKWVYGTPLLDAMSKDYVAPQRTWVGLTDDDIDTIFWGASKTDLLRVR